MFPNILKKTHKIIRSFRKYDINRIDDVNAKNYLANDNESNKNLPKLDNLNITYNSFIAPIFMNSSEDVANYEYLVESSLIKPNIFHTFLYVSLTFSVFSAFIILIIAYIFTKRANSL